MTKICHNCDRELSPYAGYWQVKTPHEILGRWGIKETVYFCGRCMGARLAGEAIKLVRQALDGLAQEAKGG